MVFFYQSPKLTQKAMKEIEEKLERNLYPSGIFLFAPLEILVLFFLEIARFFCKTWLLDLRRERFGSLVKNPTIRCLNLAQQCLNSGIGERIFCVPHLKIVIKKHVNQTIISETIEIAGQDKIAFKLPMLEQGHYLLDGFYLDKHGKVINCGSTSIQVVSVSKIRECAVSLGNLRNNGLAQCELILSQQLTDTQYIEIKITNIGGGELQTVPFLADAFSRRFAFSLVTSKLPAKPFVLQCTILDEDGVVVAHRQFIDPTLFK